MDGPIIRSLSALPQQAPAPLVLYIDGDDIVKLYVYNTSLRKYCPLVLPSCGNFTFNGTNMPFSAKVIDGYAYICCDSFTGGENPPTPSPGQLTPNRVMITDAAGTAIASPEWYHLPDTLWRGPQPNTQPSPTQARLMISNSSNIIQASNDNSTYCAMINQSSLADMSHLIGMYNNIVPIPGNSPGTMINCSGIFNIIEAGSNNIGISGILAGGGRIQNTNNVVAMGTRHYMNNVDDSTIIGESMNVMTAINLNAFGRDIGGTATWNKVTAIGNTINSSNGNSNSTILGNDLVIDGITNMVGMMNNCTTNSAENAIIHAVSVTPNAGITIQAQNSVVSSTSQRKRLDTKDSIVIRTDNGTIGPPDNPHTYLNVVEVGSLDVNNPSKTNMVTIMDNIILGRTVVNPVDPLDTDDYVTMNGVTSIGYGNEIIGDSNSSTILGRNVTLDRLPHTLVLKADDTPITYTVEPDRPYMTNIFASDGISAVNTINQQVWSSLMPETLLINIRAATNGTFVPNNFYGTMRGQQLTASNNYLHVNASAFGVASVPAPDTIDLRGQISVLMGTVKEMADIIATLDARITALGG